MLFKFYTISFVLAGILISCTTEKKAETPVFRFPNGTELTRSQVDSLADLYGRHLSLKTVNKGGKTVTTVKLPGTLPYSDDEAAKSNTELVFIDTLGNVLPEDTFWRQVADLDWPVDYERQLLNGDSVWIAKPQKPFSAEEFFADRDSLLFGEWKGKSFPFSSLPELEQTGVSPDDLKNKIIVLNYWYTTCIPCIKEMPELNRIKAEFDHRDDILFLAPTFNNQPEIESFLSSHRFEYTPIPNARDHIDVMDIQIYPTHIIVDKTGTVILIRSGGIGTILQKLQKRIHSLARNNSIGKQSHP